MPNLEAHSNPTLDLHTDAIALREGGGAVASSYLRGSSSARVPTPALTPTPTFLAVSVATPTTQTEPPPFAVRRSSFRAARHIVVGVGPATERARRRAMVAPPPLAAAAVPLVTRRVASSPLSRWMLVAAFAVGAVVAAIPVLFDEEQSGRGGDRGVATAACACLLAGAATLTAALRPGSSRGRADGN